MQEPELRAASELRLASILANDLGDLEGAVHSLEVVMAARPGDLAVRERLVELYTQVGSPNRAAEELERMVAHRTSPTDKARDELRAARTWRDAAGDPARAQRALDRAARLDPVNLDVVRERAANASGGARAQALREGAGALRSALGERSTDASLFERLLAVAEIAGDADLTFAAQGALVALGAASAEVKRKHAARRQELGPPRVGRAMTEEEWRARIEHPGVRAPWTEVWAAIAESVSPGEPSQLGFGKPDRIAWKTLAQKAPAVDAVAKLFGLGELDLWVSPARAGVARVLVREVPIVLLGEDVARPRGAEQRLALARTLALVRTRTAALEEMTLAEVELSLAAAVKTAGGDPARLGLTQGIPIAKLDDRTRQLTKAISRRDR